MPGSILSIRFPKTGDSFQPHWKTKTMKVSSFLRGQEIPLEEREKIPLVVLNGSEIIVVGNQVAKQYYSRIKEQEICMSVSISSEDRKVQQSRTNLHSVAFAIRLRDQIFVRNL